MGNSFKKYTLTNEVTIKQGKIVGRKIITEPKPVNAFQGIPFAKPPLGELRFRKPLPPVPWSEVRNCVKFANRCIQKDQFFFIERLLGGPTSEDCLYLNVFSPAWLSADENKLFPVMVFIHGGAFVFDSSVKYGDIGIAQHLVAECETVVVTIQYRLGYLGFFSTGDDACDDNVGLWDCTMALQWVQDNIEAFHGNKNNVTVFGQSAGGAIADLLSISPISRDLFHKVIPMAGNLECSWATGSNIVDKCCHFMNSLSIPTVNSAKSIEMMRNIDASKLALTIRETSQFTLNMKTPIAPRIGSEFLPKSIEELKAEAPKKKRLIGVCEYEALIFKSFLPKPSKDFFESIIADAIPESQFSNFKELRDKARSIYFENLTNPSQKDINYAVINILSDFFLNISNQISANEQLRLNNDDTYLYSFDHFNPKSFGIFSYTFPFVASTHCNELNYLLDIRMFFNFKFNESDIQVMKTITKLWSNFAKYGDPNGNENDPSSQLSFKWLPVIPENPKRYLSINVETKMKDEFFSKRINFWIQLFKK